MLLLCSLYLLQFQCKYIGGITFWEICIYEMPCWNTTLKGCYWIKMTTLWKSCLVSGCHEERNGGMINWQQIANWVRTFVQWNSYHLAVKKWRIKKRQQLGGLNSPLLRGKQKQAASKLGITCHRRLCTTWTAPPETGQMQNRIDCSSVLSILLTQQWSWQANLVIVFTLQTASGLGK